MAEQNAGIPPHPIAAGRASAPSSNHRPAAAPAGTLRPGARSRPATPTPETKDSFREVVETVVFVVVLVLLLKSFVAEAFVIPTGSMAETLWGYQKDVTCPKCGLTFPVNCSQEVDPQKGPPVPVVGCTCPNCRYYIDLAQLSSPPAPRTGDRVLVAKFLYDLKALGMSMPQRQDVVVFKFPENPQQNYIPMNYIKRLVGLPGETIAISDGDLYVLDGLQYKGRERPPKPEDLWRRPYMYPDDSQALDLFRRGEFHIIRKAPPHILAMRRLVYNNDYQAKDLQGKVPPRWGAEQAGPWKPDSEDVPRVFHHAAGSGQQVDWLHYNHLIPDSNSRTTVSKQLITDFMGYNTWEPPGGGHAPPQNWVGDLILECEATVEQAQGELVLEVSKGVDRFQAHWDLTNGKCSLIRTSQAGEEKLGEAETALKKPGTYRLRFANVDERLTVWVDRALPFGDGVKYFAPRQKGPTQENDLERPASIGVQGGAVTVAHLEVWRDTYYTNSPEGSGQEAQVDFGNPSTWDILRKVEPRTLYVQPGHFLCLGDNSPESADGRSWGAVPHRLLLGRALLVYWPYYRAGQIE